MYRIILSKRTALINFHSLIKLEHAFEFPFLILMTQYGNQQRRHPHSLVFQKFLLLLFFSNLFPFVSGKSSAKGYRKWGKIAAETRGNMHMLFFYHLFICFLDCFPMCYIFSCFWNVQPHHCSLHERKQQCNQQKNKTMIKMKTYKTWWKQNKNKSKTEKN